jgi:hypothetical protein
MSVCCRVCSSVSELDNFSDLAAMSGVMIELVQCDSNLPGKINKRCSEGAKGGHQQDGHPALVLNLEQSSRKLDDYKERQGRGLRSEP